MAEFTDSMSQDGPQHVEFDLSPADALTLDAILDSRSNPGRAHLHQDARAVRVASLLSLLDLPVPGETADQGALTDITLARIDRSSSQSSPLVQPPEEFELSEDDAEAFDALITANYDLSRVPGVLRQRATRISDLLALAGTPSPSTNQYAQAQGEDLVARTMANVPMRVRPRERLGFSVGGFRMADLVSVAAVLLIAASVVWPLLSTLRAQQHQAACGSNFASLSGAMGSYAGDYRDRFPMAAASLGGPTWWNVGAGPGQSNSANLYQLPKLQYTTLAKLACPNNAQAPRGSCTKSSNDWSDLGAVSYSYQVMFGEDRPAWHQDKPVVILADASPVTRRAARGEVIYPDQNSQNHDGRGQWALLTDGSGRWLTSPNVGGDNIWLPAALEVALQRAAERIKSGETSGTLEIHGNELPGSARDSFLGP